MKPYLILLFLGWVQYSLAQNVQSSRLTWEADEVTESWTGKKSPTPSTFKTSRKTVEWIQRKGEVKSEYVITATEGEWSDVNQTGRIVLLLERKGRTSKMILERNGSLIEITFDFSQPGTDSSLKFHIKSVQ